MTNVTRSVMLAAGGTGGHLFPAYALAEELDARGVAVDLVTDTRGDRYGTGFPARAVYQVASATVAETSPAALARTALRLSQGLASALRLIGKVRPRAVIGFGGYPTVPPLAAACLRGVPTVLHEQNAVLGRANRLLAGRVSAIATSFERTRRVEGALARKARLTGNPVRAAVLAQAASPYRPPTPQQRFVLLVFGGSQGARFFSETLPPALARLPEALRGRLELIQQCRAEDLERVRAAYAQLGIAADLAPFFKDMPEKMARAHLVVGRAGASSVAELTVMGRPAILVPLPHALDDDQLHNATTLAESGGGWCIEQANLSPERLAAEIVRLVGAPDVLASAAAAARRQGRPDAVTRLADLVEELAGLRPSRAA